MKNPEWVKGAMKTPGYIKVQLSLLMILVISSVSSTVLQTQKTEDNTLAENTSTSLESLEVSLGELNLKATGKNTTEVVTNLMKNAVGLGMMPLGERSYRSILLKDESTMRKPDNSL